MNEKINVINELFEETSKAIKMIEENMENQSPVELYKVLSLIRLMKVNLTNQYDSEKHIKKIIEFYVYEKNKTINTDFMRAILKSENLMPEEYLEKLNNRTLTEQEIDTLAKILCDFDN